MFDLRYSEWWFILTFPRFLAESERLYLENHPVQITGKPDLSLKL